MFPCIEQAAKTQLEKRKYKFKICSQIYLLCAFINDDTEGKRSRLMSKSICTAYLFNRSIHLSNLVYNNANVRP